jgi:hypothetical protein
MFKSDTQSNPACNCYGSNWAKDSCCETCDDVRRSFKKVGRVMKEGWYHDAYYFEG